jgi:hypothetical protein
VIILGGRHGYGCNVPSRRRIFVSCVCVGEKVERGLIIIGGWAVRGLCKRQTDHFAPLVHAPKKTIS